MFKVRWAIIALVAISACESGSSSGGGGSASRLSGQHFGAMADHSYSVVRGHARAGQRSQRFEVRAGDCQFDDSWSRCGSDVERSEFHPKKRWRYGSNQWMGFSVYLPSDFKASGSAKTSITIIDSETPGAIAMMHVQLIGSSANLRLWRKPQPDLVYPLLRASEMRGRWTDFTIHFDTSEGKEVLEVFVNGELRKKVENWITTRPQGEYYFYYGIHRASVSRHGGPMPTQVLFIDEGRMGSSKESVLVDEENPVD